MEETTILMSIAAALHHMSQLTHAQATNAMTALRQEKSPVSHGAPMTLSQELVMIMLGQGITSRAASMAQCLLRNAGTIGKSCVQKALLVTRQRQSAGQTGGQAASSAIQRLAARTAGRGTAIGTALFLHKANAFHRCLLA